MNAIQNVVLVGIILGFALLEYVTGRYKSFNATSDDKKIELFMFISLVAITQPLIFAMTAKMGRANSMRNMISVTASTP